MITITACDPRPICEGCDKHSCLQIHCKKEIHLLCTDCFENDKYECNLNKSIYEACDLCDFIHNEATPCPEEAEENSINQSYSVNCGKGPLKNKVKEEGPTCDFCGSKTPSGFCRVDGIYYCEFCLGEYQCKNCSIVRLTTRYYKRKGVKVYNKSGCDQPCC